MWALYKPYTSEVRVSPLMNAAMSGLKYKSLIGHSNATWSQEPKEKKICPRCVQLMQNICTAKYLSLKYDWSQVQEKIKRLKKLQPKEQQDSAKWEVTRQMKNTSNGSPTDVL